MVKLEHKSKKELTLDQDGNILSSPHEPKTGSPFKVKTFQWTTHNPLVTGAFTLIVPLVILVSVVCLALASALGLVLLGAKSLLTPFLPFSRGKKQRSPLPFKELRK